MSDNTKAKTPQSNEASLTDAAAQVASSAPKAPAPVEGFSARMASAKQSTDTKVGDQQIATMQEEIDRLRSELAEAKTAPAEEPAPDVPTLPPGVPQSGMPFIPTTMDIAQARAQWQASSEAAARKPGVNDIEGGPVFSVPFIDPSTNTVKGYFKVNGRGERVVDEDEEKSAKKNGEEQKG